MQLEQALASTDPYVREAGLTLSDRLINRGYFSAAQLRALAERMTANLQVGLGKTGEDSAFLRAYAVLVLFEIVGYDNRKKLLSAETLCFVQRETIRYLLAEKTSVFVIPLRADFTPFLTPSMCLLKQPKVRRWGGETSSRF